MVKMRAEITKGEELRYISHLDYAAAIGRAVRRSKLPAAYSEGFNPHLKMAFSSALGLGVTSDAEYMDIEFKEDISPEQVLTKLAPLLPPGIALKRIKVISSRATALMASVDLAVYEISVPLARAAAAAEQAVRQYNESQTVYCRRWSPKKGEKMIESKQYLAEPVGLYIEDTELTLRLALKMTAGGSVKASEILTALIEQFGLPVVQGEAFINRREVFAAGKNPMDL